MKTPDKIYRTTTYLDNDKGKTLWKEAPVKGAENIEYTRTDAFIEKAADKFKQLMYDQHFFEGMVYQDDIIENLVGYFKTYMKGE